jgi:nuclear pore complex protein Nup98-Nup96
VHAPNAAVTVERFAPGAGGGDVNAKRSALDVALAHTVGLNGSRRTGPSTPGRESDGDVAMDTAGETHGRERRTAPSVGPHGPLLKFKCDRLELPSLCAQHLSAVERSTTAFGASTTTPPQELAAEVGVWDLLATLFGDGEGCAPRGSAADRHARRAGVGAWLRKQIARDVPAPGDESLSGRNAAGTHVAAGRSVKAVAAAVSARDPRLATLLAQSNAGGKGKELAAAQLRIWRDSPAANYVDAPTRVAFGLLAGDVAPPPPDATPIAPGNWKANFGLHLWFGHPPTATLARSLEGYLGAVANDTAAFPAAPADTFIDPDAARLKDLCFNILALASGGTVPDDVGVEKTFHPLTYCRGDLTNVSLAWHLFVTMRAVGALGNGDKIAALADEMHVAFAAQLLAVGAGGGGVGDRKRKAAAHAGGAENGVSSSSMVEWAAFVAMHVEDGPRREALVRWTLHGRCADWCDDEVKTSFLRDTLGVPEHWLEEAKREWFAYNWWENDESAF